MQVTSFMEHEVAESPEVIKRQLNFTLISKKGVNFQGIIKNVSTSIF